MIALLSNLKYIKVDNQFTENHHINKLEFSNQEYTDFSCQNVKNMQAIINNKEYSQNTTEIISDNTSDTPLPPKGGLNNKNKNDKFIIKGKTTFANNRTQGILYSPLKPEFNYNGFNEEEIIAIKEWFDYKEEIKNPYRSQSRLNALRATLLELKESNDVVASIHHSLAAEYNSVFPAPNYLLKNR